MSIYEQALLDAKKLKEVAEKNAQRAIIDAATPAIKKMIAEELATANSSSFLLEEQEDLLSQAAPSANMDMPQMPVSSPTSSEMSGGDAPIKLSNDGDDSLKMPLPGPDGKFVVDFDDLFVSGGTGSDSLSALADTGPASAEQGMMQTGEVEPGGAVTSEPVDVSPTVPASPESPPSPTSPEMGAADATAPLANPEEPVSEIPLEAEPKTETVEMFQESFEKVKAQITRVYESKGIRTNSLIQEALQEKLFNLLEMLETLSVSGKISQKASSIFEKRLEILHRKLKDGNSVNTYDGIQKDKEEDMASRSLKEYVNKVLAESTDVVKGGDVTSPADVHKTEKSMKVTNSQEQAADKAGSHAMKVTEPTVTLSLEEQAEKALEEEIRAVLAEDEGESLVAKPGKQDLAGAASSIPDEKVGQVDTTKSTDASPTNPASHVLSVKEGKKKDVKVGAKDLEKETKKMKKENLQKQIAKLQEQLKECGDMGMEEASPMGTGESVSSMEPMKEEGEVVNVNFNFDLADLLPDLAGLSDDDEIEIVDDTVPGAMDSAGDVSALDSGSMGDEGSSDLDLGSSEEEEEEEMPGEESGEDEDLSSLMESKKAKPSAKPSKTPVANKILQENKLLKAALHEQQLFNAKTVHFGVFLKNKNLSNEQKQKIAAYLDRAKTITEVKSAYNKVKSILESVTKARSTKTGSSSKPGATAITESTKKENLFEGKSLVEEQKNRLMELAGIKKK